MMKAKGCHAIYPFLTSILLLVPTSSQELPRETAQPASARGSRTADAQDERAAEQRLWDSIKEGADPQKYKNFLAKYPQGQFHGAARARLSALVGEDYVTLFTKRISVNQQWAQVARQLARRADLIPPLFLSLKEAGVQELEMFGQIAEARSRLLNATNAAPQGEADDQTPEQKRAVIEADYNFGRTLGRLDTLLENYPQLRSNERFMNTRDSLEGIGNRINVVRSDYNSAVRDYNAARRQPQAAATVERHGFAEEPYFKPEQGQPVEPQVNSAPPLLPISLPASIDDGARNLDNRPSRTISSTRLRARYY